MALADIERLVKDTTGLDPEAIGVAAVARAVRQRSRARRVSDAIAYWDLLQESTTELQALIDSVVVAETWLFRDAEAFAALGRFVQDEWLRSHPAGLLRLLSLPCATGEEPYSMAITLLDAGLTADRFHIDAVDISERLLERGRLGVYGARAFRGNLVDVRRRHFDATAGGWRVTDTVRRQVQFHHGNVFSPSLLPDAEPYDVIFSRNLLIYFDRPTQDRAIDVLSGLLSTDGLLFVGPSETVALMNRGFVSEGTRKAFSFRRAGNVHDGAARAEEGRPVPFVPRLLNRPPVARSIRVGREATVAASSARHDAAGLTASLEASTRLANEGRFEDAVRGCEDSIERYGPSAGALYLLGLVKDALGDPLEAMSCYQKALYLNPRHEEALVHLALLLEVLDRKPEAQRLRARAQRAALRSGT